MEAVVAVASHERGLEMVLPLSMAGVRARAVVSSGAQLMTELARGPVQAVVIADMLSDGPAEHWLRKIAALGTQRPLVIVLLQAPEGGAELRDRLIAVYGGTLEGVQASARYIEDVGAEAGRIIARWGQQAVGYAETAAGGNLADQATGGPCVFVGVSGGVGTSTLVANLAAYAAMAQRRVLVVDAQFATSGNLHYYLNAPADDQQCGLHHLRRGYLESNGVPTDGAADELIQHLAEVRYRGVEHLPVHLLHVPAVLDHMIGLPVEHVLWGIQVLERFYDLVLVDCGSGIGASRTLKLLSRAGRIFLVTGGWGGSVVALGRCLDALEGQLDLGRITYLLREATGETRMDRSAAQAPVSGRLPDEPLLHRSRSAEDRAGRPLVIDHPSSPYAQAVARLAGSVGIMRPVAADTKSAGARRRWGLRLGNR